MAVEVFMPKMSDHMEVGEIIRWLVKEGDRVEQGQVIMEVMTDKVVADLEAPASGVLKGIRKGAEDGAIIPVGETFAFIAQPDETVPGLPPLAPTEGKVEETTAGVSPPNAGVSSRSAGIPIPAQEAGPVPGVSSRSAGIPIPAQEAGPVPGVSPRSAGIPIPAQEAGPVRATPVARRLARELGVDLSQVKGTGPGGRIKDEDVRAFAEARQPTAPTVASAELAEVAGAVRASPVARRVARELGVDIAQVKGTGPGGRIKEEDVQAYAQGLSAAPAAQPVEAEVKWLDLNSIQRLTGQRMLESLQSAPQFALTVNVDATNLLWLREALMERVVAETGERLSITALLVKIVAAALKQYPRANASFENGRVKLHGRVNIGVAVGTDAGLVVPVVKDADQKTLVQIMHELNAYQAKAQPMRFSADDLSGGTFTISNLGMYGIDRFNAIINPPESAILAVGRTVKTPVGMPDDTIALRPMMSLTLTIDHRSMDGVQGARLLTEIKERIEKPYFLL